MQHIHSSKQTRQSAANVNSQLILTIPIDQLASQCVLQSFLIRHSASTKKKHLYNDLDINPIILLFTLRTSEHILKDDPSYLDNYAKLNESVHQYAEWGIHTLCNGISISHDYLFEFYLISSQLIAMIHSDISKDQLAQVVLRKSTLSDLCISETDPYENILRISEKLVQNQGNSPAGVE